MLMLVIVIYIVLSTAGLMLVKRSLLEVGGLKPEHLTASITNYKFLAGTILYAASFLTWLLLLSLKQVTYIYPIVVGLAYLAIMIGSVTLLHESLTTSRIVGISLIGVGLFLVAR